LDPEAFFSRFRNLERTGDFHQARTLDRIRELLARVGDPQRALPPVIIIAGSKGKGSTAHLTASILGAAGLRTGLYTSPHIVRWNERIVAHGQEITDAEAAALIARFGAEFERPCANGETATYFEIMTAAAFLHFAASRLDAVVLEVGLGGTYDAVNICDAQVAVITQLGLEHQKVLGATLPEIAREKAGVMRPGQYVILERQPLDATTALWRHVEEIGARKIDADRWSVHLGDSTRDHQEFSLLSGAVEYGPLRLGLLGDHQVRNARLAVMAAFAFGEKTGREMPDEAVRRGLLGVRVPVRMELIDGGSPAWLLDGAHNTESADALADGVLKHFSGSPVRLAVGMLRDKDPAAFMNELKRLNPIEVIAVAVDSDRSWGPDELHKLWEPLGIRARKASAWAEAERMIREDAQPGDLALVTGSLYLAGEARKALRRS
jgi:dihydrofolate synthase/folylpolyglutamate synthase